MYDESRIAHNWILKRTLNRLVLDQINQLSGTVIDLGCGRRVFETEVRKRGCEYFGLDWGNSAHGLHADAIANLNCAIPLLDGCVDHILSLEVLEHLCEPDTMIREAFRVLRPGGTIAISTPFQWWVHEAPWDYFRYTEFGLRHLFEKAGFREVSILATSGFWTTWIVKLNYQTARLIRGPSRIRAAIRLLLIPLWWLNQNFALAADRVWSEPRETVGYFLTAKKE